MEEQHSIINVGIFWMASLIGIPLGVLLSSVYRPIMHVVFCLLLISLISPHLSITFYSEEHYKSATRGFEVHFADLMMLILFFSLLFRPRTHKLYIFPPLTLLTVLYLLVGFVSWAMIDHSTVPNFDKELEGFSVYHPSMYPFFEMSKIVRGYFIYWVAVNYLTEVTTYRLLVGCCVFLLLCFTFGALFSRYGQHMNRATLPMFHVNDFNTLVGIVGVFLFPWAFASRKFLTSFFFWFLGGCAYVVIILTISRSSLAGYTCGAFFVVTICLGRFVSLRNVVMTVLAFILAILLLGKALDTLLERFTIKGTETAAEGRSLVNDSAIMMAKQHLFGVGLGNFSFASVTQFARTTGADPYNIAHNIWFLTLGEVGFFGLAVFICLWLKYYSFLFRGLILSLKQDWDMAFTLIVGVLCSSLVMQFQNLYHFSYRQTSVFFLTQILAGLAIRLYLDMRANGKEKIVSK